MSRVLNLSCFFFSGLSGPDFLHPGRNHWLHRRATGEDSFVSHPTSSFPVSYINDKLTLFSSAHAEIMHTSNLNIIDWQNEGEMSLPPSLVMCLLTTAVENNTT